MFDKDVTQRFDFVQQSPIGLHFGMKQSRRRFDRFERIEQRLDILILDID